MCAFVYWELLIQIDVKKIWDEKRDARMSKTTVHNGFIMVNVDYMQQSVKKFVRTVQNLSAIALHFCQIPRVPDNVNRKHMYSIHSQGNWHKICALQTLFRSFQLATSYRVKDEKWKMENCGILYSDCKYECVYVMLYGMALYVLFVTFSVRLKRIHSLLFIVPLTSTPTPKCMHTHTQNN